MSVMDRDRRIRCPPAPAVASLHCIVIGAGGRAGCVGGCRWWWWWCCCDAVGPRRYMPCPAEALAPARGVPAEALTAWTAARVPQLKGASVEDQ